MKFPDINWEVLNVFWRWLPQLADFSQHKMDLTHSVLQKLR